MHLVVEGAEPCLVDVGVDLGRADVGVAKHGLDGAEVSAVVQQVGGNGAPSASERSEEREDAP
jgi:hypothetical protein